jgi:alpha-tubulin suppressor-like RCC1 family protein
MKCWGLNDQGQLGLGNTTDTNAPGAITNVGDGRHVSAVAPGGYYTCAILDDRSVKCWGYDGVGELGLGGPFPQRGTTAPTIATNLGPGRTALSIATNFNHVCALLDDHTVKCWGEISEGALGVGESDYQYVTGPGAAVNLGPGRTAKAVTTGNGFTCAWLDDDSIKCWGLNGTGQLGLGSDANTFTPTVAVDLGAGHTARSVVAGDSHACAILDDGSVKCWGDNREGQLGLGISDANVKAPGAPVDLGVGRTARAVTAGYLHTCALLDDDSIKCWGSLNYVNHRVPGPPVDLGAGRTPKSLVSGENYVCALLDNATVKCWGYNERGQLGTGNNTSTNDPLLVTGLIF